jgi:hypothetical protein
MPKVDMVLVNVKVFKEVFNDEGLVYYYTCDNGHQQSDKLNYPREEVREVPLNLMLSGVLV